MPVFLTTVVATEVRDSDERHTARHPSCWLASCSLLWVDDGPSRGPARASTTYVPERDVFKGRAVRKGELVRKPVLLRLSPLQTIARLAIAGAALLLLGAAKEGGLPARLPARGFEP